MSRQINIELAYALPTTQTLLSFKVDEGSTIEAAILSSGILQQFKELDLTQVKVGIWSKTKKLEEIVRAGDRIEIYRPLIADPKEIRKIRAEKAKVEGRANKVTGGVV